MSWPSHAEKYKRTLFLSRRVLQDEANRCTIVNRSHLALGSGRGRLSCLYFEKSGFHHPSWIKSMYGLNCVESRNIYLISCQNSPKTSVTISK